MALCWPLLFSAWASVANCWCISIDYHSSVHNVLAHKVDEYNNINHPGIEDMSAGVLLSLMQVPIWQFRKFKRLSDGNLWLHSSAQESTAPFSCHSPTVQPTSYIHCIRHQRLFIKLWCKYPAIPGPILIQFQSNLIRFPLHRSCSPSIYRGEATVNQAKWIKLDLVKTIDIVKFYG